MSATTTPAQPDLAREARRFLAGGLSLVPCSAQTKRPEARLLPRDPAGKPTWAPYQATPATAETVAGWFRRGCQSVAVVGGAVSGGLLILDFDVPRFHDAWREQVGDLAAGLPTQQTGGGGYQVFLRCPDPGRNDKLAWARDESEETGRRIAIETRAEGGYAVLPGSLHPTGNFYVALAGDFGNVPSVPQARADALLAAARKLDEAPMTRQQMEAKAKAAPTSNRYTGGSNGRASIIETYNERVTIGEALEAAGYRRMGDRYARPGGTHANVKVDEGRSFHWGTNDPLCDGHWHRPFDIYCSYSHGGDCRAAVKAAADLLGLRSVPRSAGSSCPSTPDGDHFPLTDSGNAERLVHLFGAGVRFCHPWGKWLVWDGRRWALDAAGEAQQLAKKTAREIIRAAADVEEKGVRDAMVCHARRSESAGGRTAMLRCAESEPGVPVQPAELDRDAWALNVQNGTIDLRSGKLRPHEKKDLFTKLAPCVYDSDATCPTWERFLSEVFGGDAELVAFVQRFLGYCLSGDVSEQILTIWHGVGANGKSTLVNAILDVLGEDYALKAPADMLLAKRGLEHPTALTDLHGKRLVACIETDEGRRLAEAMAKELTGGDPIRARRMREDFWQFWPTHKILLACNHKPTVRGTDRAIWRRIRLVPFNVVIPPERRDKTLPERLRAERSGILGWLLRGCLDWQREGLGEPAAVVAATADYQAAEDALGQFLFECCEVAPHVRVKAADLVDLYQRWGGDRSMTTRRMTKLLSDRGVPSYKNSGVWYRGVGILATGGTGGREEFSL